MITILSFCVCLGTVTIRDDNAIALLNMANYLMIDDLDKRVTGNLIE